MSFDTLIMKAVTDELQTEAAGAAVQRVFEPKMKEIVIQLYHRNRQLNLLFSIDPDYARVYLTAKRGQNKEQPSPFCMLLRKYLVGGRAACFSTPPLERILYVSFEPPEGLPPVKLVAEIMGRRSNLVLVDENENILGAAKTVSWEKNPRRAILPGEKYRPVPAQDKLDPLKMQLEEFREAFQKQLESGRNTLQALLGAVKGISPLTAEELLHRSGLGNDVDEPGADRLFKEVRKIFRNSSAGRIQPVMLPGYKIYAAFPLRHLAQEKQKKYAGISEMLDRFYDNLIRENRERQFKEQLKTTVEKRLENLERKKREQEKELQAAEKAPQYRRYGELLLAYRDRVERGADRVVLPDLYNPEEKVAVPLDPSKSVSANTERYFNRYRKAKNSRGQVRKQLGKTRAEIEYCRELLYTIESGNETSLEEIRREMIEVGYIGEKAKERRKNEPVVQPLSFKTSSGHTVLVGRNNRQNDYITFKAAVRRDTWFHVRRLPGSHVLLKEVSYPPPPEDIEEAAFLAAYFSKGRESSAADVDYTAVRHVRRRPGGKPGFVFYDNYETITANPQDQRLRKLFSLN